MKIKKSKTLNRAKCSKSHAQNSHTLQTPQMAQKKVIVKMQTKQKIYNKTKICLIVYRAVRLAAWTRTVQTFGLAFSNSNRDTDICPRFPVLVCAFPCIDFETVQGVTQIVLRVTVPYILGLYLVCGSNP